MIDTNDLEAARRIWGITVHLDIDLSKSVVNEYCLPAGNYIVSSNNLLVANDAAMERIMSLTKEALDA
jgi:hypothetical protein